MCVSESETNYEHKRYHFGLFLGPCYSFLCRAISCFGARGQERRRQGKSDRDDVKTGLHNRGAFALKASKLVRRGGGKARLQGLRNPFFCVTPLSLSSVSFSSLLRFLVMR